MPLELRASNNVRKETRVGARAEKEASLLSLRYSILQPPVSRFSLGGARLPFAGSEGQPNTWLDSRASPARSTHAPPSRQPLPRALTVTLMRARGTDLPTRLAL